jgi:hypothetical protein
MRRICSTCAWWTGEEPPHQTARHIGRVRRCEHPSDPGVGMLWPWMGWEESCERHTIRKESSDD